MKIFQNRNIFKKLIIVFLSVLLLGFCTPKTVKATNGNEDGIGGKLLNPIISMFVGLGDGAISLLQKIVLHQDASMIEVNTSVKGIAKILGIVVAAVIIVGGIIAVVASGGMSLAIVGPVLTVFKAGVIAGVVTFCVSGAIADAVLPDDFVLPQISLSPYEIFANQIPLFDVDFFNPSESMMVDNRKTNVIKADVVKQTIGNYVMEQLKKDYGYTDSIKEEDVEDAGNPFNSNQHKEKNIKKKTWTNNGKTYIMYYSGEIVKVDDKNTDYRFDDGKVLIERYNSDGTNDEYLDYNDYSSTNEDGLNVVNLKWVDSEGKDTISNPNWQETEISVKNGEDKVETTGEIEEIKSVANELKSTISSWYIVLRDLSLVALLSVLVYVGIRIIISSTSKDKAKYKQMLVDWLVAICLLFVMHYIMAFSNMLVKQFINLVDATDVVENKDQLPENTTDGEISSEGVAVTKGIQVFDIDDKKQVEKAYDVLVGDNEDSQFKGYFDYNSEGKPSKLHWPASNFTEQARMMAQFVDADNKASNYAYAGIGYTIIYCVLIVYTVIFVFTYLKRTVYMAFLTLIAPLVAVTYPIDKINDGQAQAFNKWFKEYIFNLLIQPLHLILYMVLVGSAMDFAAQNIIYVVIALGFLTQGEKLLRMFFGFEKAHTPGFLAGPAGAAIMMNGFNKLLGRPPHKGGKGPKEIDDESKEKENSKINMKTALDSNSMFSIGDGNKATGIKEKGILGLGGDDSKLGIDGQNTGINIDTKNNANSKKLFANSGSSRNLPNINETLRVKPANLNMPKRSAIRGIKKIGSNIRMKSPTSREYLRKLSGVAGAALAAGTAGIIGITSGDVGKAAQYMSAGAIGGYNFGKEVPDAVGKFGNTIEEYTDAFKEGYYTDDEYQELLQKKAQKEAAKNDKLNINIKSRLENADIDVNKDYLKKVRDNCIVNGLDDAKDIATVYQEYENGENIEDAMLHVKYVKKYGKDISELSHKDMDDFYSTIRDRVRENNGAGISEEEVNSKSYDLVNRLKRTSKNYYKK